MTPTQTSSFGTGKREAHDASAYYERKLHRDYFADPLPESELQQVETPAPEGWSDKIYNASSEAMTAIPDNSIALAFTSPPYNVGKDYDETLHLDAYLQLIENVGTEVYRVLRPGGRYVINIANLGRKPYIPLHAFFWEIHRRLDFLPMGEIIWQKGKGANSSCAWGSWKSASAPRLRDVHEYLLVFAKQAYKRPDAGVSDVERDEFMASTLSIWSIKPESARRVGHPAPFPVELAERVLRLYSYCEDVVLDPFVGSGTTCVAACQNDRHFVGYDIDPDYCELAYQRLQEAGFDREA